jgi:Glycosyl hydrolases family 2, sugar binding domain.
MRLLPHFFFLVLFVTQFSTFSSFAIERDRLFDGDWRFQRGDIAGAEAPEFNDSTWRTLDLPHDWSIQKTFQGRCLAILRPSGVPGKITLTAEADGFEPDSVSIKVGR